MYVWPTELRSLQNWLKDQGVDVRSMKSERQAAFMGQQLAGTRFKFPEKGKSCFRVMQSIQGALPEKAVGTRNVAARAKRQGKQKEPRRGKKVDLFEAIEREAAVLAPPLTNGLVIYTDGCCEPNPGFGGWAFVVYRDGIEIHSDSGGELKATNQTMELTAALMALCWFASRGIVEPVRLISDSMYVVNGCNDWRHGWKRKGWRRGVEKELANAELWQDLDRALTAVPIKLEWCKGHVGIVGNERADELSEIGREQALPDRGQMGQIERQLGYSVESG